jgi:polysaccharide pyruvyl transferase WcaK-like protein
MIFAAELANIGDYILLKQTITILRDLGVKGDITARQWGVPKDAISNRHDQLGCRVIRTRNLFDYLGSSLGACLIIGGGQAIRKNMSLASLISMALCVVVAKATEGKLVFIGCGVSRVTSPIRKIIWRYLLKSADLVSIRDSGSLVNAHALMKNDRAYFTGDLALLCPEAEEVPEPTFKPLLTIAPCIDVSENRAFSIDGLVRVVTQVAAQRGLVEICVLAHDVRENIAPPVCREIAKKITATSGHLKISVITSGSLEEYFAIYRKSNIVISNRLHAILLSIMFGAKTIVLDDSNSKIAEIVKYFKLVTLPATLEDSSGLDWRDPKNDDTLLNREVLVKMRTHSQLKLSLFKPIIEHYKYGT